MKFVEITEEIKVYPGEYILHVPTNQVVLCGSFNRRDDVIRVLARGKMFNDSISNFKKMQMTATQKKEMKKSSCKGCRGRR
tara:strand:+ start:888 stop:1130 length:243 start_codon:yes stop_codon:yes gene_type:complete